MLLASLVAQDIVKCRTEGAFYTASDLTRAGMTQKQVVKILAYRFGGAEEMEEVNDENKNPAPRRSRRSSVAA